MTSPWPLPLIVGLLVAACGSGADEATELTVGAAIQVVPGDGLPPEVTAQNANNNLDVVRHDGRIYLAFRTAPTHFASDKVVLYVVSAADDGAAPTSWRFETALDMDTDLREPRFLSLGGRLRLYFAVLGASALDFAPKEARVVERADDGAWGESETFYEPGFIPWRIVVRDDRAFMIGYTGGENIYDMDASPVRIHWLVSDDGDTWTPAAGDDPVVLEGGGSETGFDFADDGAVVGVVRNEHGDEDGWGSKVCRADADSLGDWRCEPDPKKYDSPLVFNHQGALWLIGRRHLSDTGQFDVSDPAKSHGERTIQNQLAYWEVSKRCALWRVDPEALTTEWIADLPSKGDTCFASVLHAGGDDYDVYNYTSPVDGPDVGWQDGQYGPTVIYRARVTLPR